MNVYVSITMSRELTCDEVIFYEPPFFDMYLYTYSTRKRCANAQITFFFQLNKKTRRKTTIERDELMDTEDINNRKVGETLLRTKEHET